MLTEVQLIGVSGQVCSCVYELAGREKQVFNNRQEAEAAFAALYQDAAA